jgi:hypothetical protein
LMFGSNTRVSITFLSKDTGLNPETLSFSIGCQTGLFELQWVGLTPLAMFEYKCGYRIRSDQALMRCELFHFGRADVGIPSEGKRLSQPGKYIAATRATLRVCPFSLFSLEFPIENRCAVDVPSFRHVKIVVDHY